MPSAVGDFCSPDLQCKGGHLLCGSDQKCHAFGLPNEPCAGSLKLCVVGTCGADGKCPVLGLGDFCSGNNAECGPNALCLYSTTESRYRCTASCL